MDLVEGRSVSFNNATVHAIPPMPPLPGLMHSNHVTLGEKASCFVSDPIGERSLQHCDDSNKQNTCQETVPWFGDKNAAVHPTVGKTRVPTVRETIGGSNVCGR